MSEQQPPQAGVELKKEVKPQPKPQDAPPKAAKGSVLPSKPVYKVTPKAKDDKPDFSNIRSRQDHMARYKARKEAEAKKD